MPQMKSALDNRTLANALRMLAIDSVEQAKSGHPGAPMGLSDIAQVLWNRYFKQRCSRPGLVCANRCSMRFIRIARSLCAGVVPITSSPANNEVA
jgi:transketolase N-terminal domain/subunit